MTEQTYAIACGIYSFIMGGIISTSCIYLLEFYANWKESKELKVKL